MLVTLTIFVIAACQKICVARGAAPRPTTPTHFVPRPYPGIFYHQLSNYGVQRDILLKSFSTQVMWPALPMATPQPPIQRTLQARPFLTTRSPLHHTISMLCHTIPYHTIPQCHQVSTCTPISHFSCPGLPSACSSTSSCFSFKGRACKLFCNLYAFLEDDCFFYQQWSPTQKFEMESCQIYDRHCSRLNYTLSALLIHFRSPQHG